MICPHCNRTISEQHHYTMSRDPEAEWPQWGKYALYVLALVILTGLIYMARTHGL